MSGCLRPTPVDNLPILAGIQPAELNCKGATLSLACRAMEPGHLLHSALTHPPGANAEYIKLRNPFVLAAEQLIGSSDNNNMWRTGWITNGRRSAWTTLSVEACECSTEEQTIKP